MENVPSTSSCLAVRQAGGNDLDDIRINLSASYEVQERYIAEHRKKTVQQSLFRSFKNRLFYICLQRLGLFAPLSLSGVYHKWFDEFLDYWTHCLAGRPITVSDFHALSYDYRKRFHANIDRNWDGAAQHVANYQTPENLFLTFSFVIREALNPIRNHQLLHILKPGMRILEFGCSIAPMYRTWRQFGSHKECHWVLADIANHPFHYARHVYAGDLEATTCLITEELFDDPLANIQGKFDVIIIQEVFEHLHKPLHIARYLIDRLKGGGWIFFDYIKSDAEGLDTSAGLEERDETLKFLFNALVPLAGAWGDPKKSVSLSIGRKE